MAWGTPLTEDKPKRMPASLNDACNVKRRMLVIGLDGAPFGLVSRMVKEGHLHNIGRLMEQGSWGVLRSTIPPFTSPVWRCLCTGKNPGKLGVFGFLRRRKGSYDWEVENFGEIDSECVWDILGRHGARIAVIGVPTTFPPAEVNGIMVSGWPIPKGGVFVFPPDLQESIQRMGWETDRDWKATWRFDSEEEFLRGLYAATESQFQVVKHMITASEWDFFMTVFPFTDSVQHFMWKYMDETHPLHDKVDAGRFGGEIVRYYRKIDEMIGELIRIAGESCSVFLVSDHGAGPLRSVFNVNNWLVDRGYMEISNKGFGRIIRIAISSERLRSALRKSRMLQCYYVLSDKLAQTRLLSRIVPDHARLWGKALFAGVNWNRSVAYGIGVGNAGYIYVNVKEREPNGVVNPEDYTGIRERIINDLRDLRWPDTLQKIPVLVFRGEQIYHGEKVQQAPDIVFFLGNFTVDVASMIDPTGKVHVLDVSSRHDSGTHTMEGILVAKADGMIKRNLDLGEASIFDVTPTILHLMGCPIPSDLDGRVLEIMIEPSFAKHPVITGTPSYAKRHGRRNWSKQEEQEILERLKRLGYL